MTFGIWQFGSNFSSLTGVGDRGGDGKCYIRYAIDMARLDGAIYIQHNSGVHMTRLFKQAISFCIPRYAVGLFVQSHLTIAR